MNGCLGDTDSLNYIEFYQLNELYPAEHSLKSLAFSIRNSIENKKAVYFINLKHLKYSQLIETYNFFLQLEINSYYQLNDTLYFFPAPKSPELEGLDHYYLNYIPYFTEN